MGEQHIRNRPDDESMRAFMRQLLEDVRALDQMIERDWFETGIRCIGAEQEMFLVDRSLAPANRALEILARLPRESFTTELGQFNLELNLKPHMLSGKCLSAMERELEEGMAQVRAVAAEEGTNIVLTGILPTLEKEHLGLESMTPIPRYYQLNQVMSELRGGDFRTLIKGLDELQESHDNVMLEACNTSFQIHFQVGPEEFPRLYNVAQVVTAPVLAAATNSPVLLRHRLWHETRVALFQQSLDTRSAAQAKRGGRMRVSFGDDWVQESVLEIFREDVARFRALIAADPEESPLAQIEAGKTPELKALRLHNGTVYRWNRPCYGISASGKPHLRIENRVLPAGPTLLDEVANAAFFFGLMCAVVDEYRDVRKAIPFDDAKGNFMAAARYGLQARLRWFGRKVSADDLILNELIPIARQGLIEHDLDSSDVDRYLQVIKERVTSGRTGSQWTFDSLDSMEGQGRPDERYRSLTSALLENQWTGEPCHRWPLARVRDTKDIRDSYRKVGQIMSTDLFTVHPEDLIDLAASVMDWEHLRHVPVEDQEGRLVGLVTHRMLLRMVGSGPGGSSVAVREIMRSDPVTVTPETSTLDAIARMRTSKLGCLPVVQDDKLVGIVTESDFIDVSAKLLDEWLRED